MIRKPISNRTATIFKISSLVLAVLIYSGLCSYQKHLNSKDTTVPNLTQLGEGVRQSFYPESWKMRERLQKDHPDWIQSKIEEFVLLKFPDGPGQIWIIEDAKATYGRHFLGLVIGVSISIIIGIGMGCFAKVETFFIWPVSLLSRIPPTAMLSLCFIVCGVGLKMFVAMIILGIIPTLTQSIYRAAKTDVNEDLIFKAYTYGATNWEVIFDVVFRQILPRIFDNVRLVVGPAMVFLIAAEYSLGDVGFGYRLRMQSRLTNMNVVFIYLAVLGLSGYLYDVLLMWLTRKLCPWWRVKT